MRLDLRTERALDGAAQLLDKADAVLVALGSSLAAGGGALDPRGPGSRGWRQDRGSARLDELAHPRWFERDPARAWAFYGRLLEQARSQPPGPEYALLLQLLAEREHFLITANVDGLALRAGIAPDRIYELFGSIHQLQRVDARGGTWPADDVEIHLDDSGLRARPPLPADPRDQAPARPNILMVGDWRWRDERSGAQAKRYRNWLADQQGGSIVVLELGLGPTGLELRKECERRHLRDSTLVRVDPQQYRVPRGCVFLGIEVDLALRGLVERLLG